MKNLFFEQNTLVKTPDIRHLTHIERFKNFLKNVKGERFSSHIFQKQMDFVDMRSAVGFGTRPYESQKIRV